MLKLPTLLWQGEESRPLLNRGPYLRSTGSWLGAHIPLKSLASPSRHQQQQYYCSSHARGKGENSLDRPPQARKSDSVPAYGRPTVGKVTTGPRRSTLQRQGKEGSGTPWRKGTQPPKQPGNQAGPRPSGYWIHIPVDQLKANVTCEGLWDMLSNIQPHQLHAITLSAALDQMVAISKRPGYQQTQQGLLAVELLLTTAENQLGRMHTRGLVAFIRCAAGFKGLLQPAGLSAWQRELLQRQRKIEQLTGQGVANTLLSLGTVTESDPQLARVLDVELAGQLLQHAVSSAHGPSDSGGFSAWDAGNVLYGAVLLGLQPDGAQVAALFSAVQRGIRGLGTKDLTQVLLASQKFIDKAKVMRQEHGLEAWRPEVDPFHVYYPGDKLMGLLVERACDLIQQRRLYPREASQILGASGFLGYLPSNLALKKLLTVLESGELTSIDASTTLVGCARLGTSPPAEVVMACWQALMRDGGQDTQPTANAAWALVLVGACTSQMWEILTSRLMANPKSTPQVHLQQWHQAYLLMKLQHSQSLACPPELLERSLAAHQAGLARPTTPTHFEQALAKAVQQLAQGQDVQLEYLVPEPYGQGWLRVDVALPGLKLAVEADGPRHFLRNVKPPQQAGLTKARDRLLRGWGWSVIVVAVHVWDELYARDASHEELVDGLGTYLMDHTDIKQYIRAT